MLGAGYLFVQARSDQVLVQSGMLLGTLGVAAAMAIVWSIWALLSVRDARWVARRIETKHPELGTGLLAAVEQAEATPAGRFGFLQTAVIRGALEHARTHNWDETVPAWALRGTQLVHVAALALFFVVSMALAVQARSRAHGGSAIAWRTKVADVQVEPGDTEIERGTSLLVVARFQGAVPGDARLVVEDDSHRLARRGMTRSLEDPTFAGRVESVETDLAYRVEFEGNSTRSYHARVFEYPELKRADARLHFPRYTALAPKTIEDVRHVTAVEGSELTLLCRLNKEVATAKLVDPAGRAIELAPLENKSHVYRATIMLSDPQRYRVQLVDREGRANKLTAEIVANVTRNRPPTIRMSQPGRDARVSPVEELTLKAELEDDFGLVRHGLSYSMAGQEPREIILEGPGSLGRRKSAQHLLDFESFRAVPDHLVSYCFWAEDIGPDEKLRRAAGDMFFAEVRHFEEIFRQGEQPPERSAQDEDAEGGGDNARAADQLAELEKQIVSGTWTLIRRETGARPSAKLADDGKVLRDSQKTAIDRGGELAGRLQDAASKASLEQAMRFMRDAEKHLAGAAQGSTIAPLNPALAAEQAAYQALLKLRAREFEVVRNSRGRRGRGSASGPSQRQLDQLELSADENRYEEQRTARSQQGKRSQREEEERETRQVLNRLRELAQRQADLNERLKELQSALEAAQTEEARQDIARQLKRLREEERQILRDTDELRERMEREENRQRMADAREQMEESREHVRAASEALENGRLSRAVTEGARAGRQLHDLREQLRKRASNRFAEELTDMRGQARRLDEDQGRLSEKLDAATGNEQRSLRDTDLRRQVRQGLKEQQTRLQELLDQMQRTVQDAEETEPLLAKGLYDTARKATEQKIPDALKVAEQLTGLGVTEDAAKASQHAGRGIKLLREGVERAAKSVLGDETAALRRAQGELEDLGDEVNREIARATGREPVDRKPSSQSSREPRGRTEPGRPGQARKGEARSEPGQQGQARKGGAPSEPAQQGQARKGGAPSEPGQQGQARPRRQGQRSLRGRAGRDRQDGPDGLLGGLPSGPGGPITGEGFREWSDRMRDVEELLDDREWRAEAARIRDRVREARQEFKRHSKEPDWNRLKDLVAQPIVELRDRIAEELRRRESPGALVPIDRDPVPPQFTEGVRRYYERLGSGQ
jgi:hypothetical protein